MKLPALVDAFLTHCQIDRRLAAGTLRVYRLWLTRLLEFWQKKKFGVRRLQAERISDFLQWLDRRAKERRGRPLEPATQDKAFDSVSAFVTWGRNFNHIKSNPFLVLEPPKVPDKPRVVWPKARILELVDFIEHFADHRQPARVLEGRFHPRRGGRRLQPNPRGWREKILCERDAALLATEYFTGGRISAICPLRPTNLDFDNDFVTMPKVKGGGWHTVPMHHELKRHLRRWVRRRELLWRKYHVCSPFLFPTLPGRGCHWVDSRGHVDASRIERVLREVYLPAFRELHPSLPPEHFTPHCLRHSLATRLLDLNVRPRSVQELLGHASLDTTMIYQRLRPRHLRDAVARG